MTTTPTDLRPSTFDIRPPSSRDLEIHRQNAVEFLSTYRIAENFKISQTRVRQIIARVNDWLAEVIPAPTEADIEKQKRLAVHLAAAQLRHQIEELQTFWRATSDPKYLRQQNRSILALARLGVPATTLDALTAQIEDEQEASPPTRGASEGNASSNPADVGVSLPESAIPNPKSQIQSPSSPPLGDCSPIPVPAAESANASIAAESATPSSNTELDPAWLLHPDTLAGLNLIEKRLLTLLDDTLHSDTDRRSSLTDTLDRVRREKASLILKLSPATPGLQLDPATAPPSSVAPEHRAGTSQVAS